MLTGHSPASCAIPSNSSWQHPSAGAVVCKDVAAGMLLVWLMLGWISTLLRGYLGLNFALLHYCCGANFGCAN